MLRYSEEYCWGHGQGLPRSHRRNGVAERGVSDRAATLDLTMMVAAGAIERTLGEWQALLDMAGFKIERIETYTVSLNDSIIVATPK